jgi:hypothetical protein
MFIFSGIFQSKNDNVYLLIYDKKYLTEFYFQFSRFRNLETNYTDVLE